MSASSRFGGSVLDRLDARISPSAISAPAAGVAKAQRVPINLIDQDPSQPRRTFNEAELQQLAASISLVGILQPVGLALAPNGRYLLRWGARRLRAASLAGLSDIPAVLVSDQQMGIEAQVVENAHRASNSNSELAAVVGVLTERGMKNAEIATVLALPDPQSLKYYRVLLTLEQTAPLLMPWIDKASPRAVYEMAVAFGKSGPLQRESIIATLADLDEMTVTMVRRIVAATADPEEIEASSAETVLPAISQQPVAAQSQLKASRPVDPDAERVAKVRVWLANTARPRPSLNV